MKALHFPKLFADLGVLGSPRVSCFWEPYVTYVTYMTYVTYVTYVTDVVVYICRDRVARRQAGMGGHNGSVFRHFESADTCTAVSCVMMSRAL